MIDQAERNCCVSSHVRLSGIWPFVSFRIQGVESGIQLVESRIQGLDPRSGIWSPGSGVQNLGTGIQAVESGIWSEIRNPTPSIPGSEIWNPRESGIDLESGIEGVGVESRIQRLKFGIQGVESGIQGAESRIQAVE